MRINKVRTTITLFAFVLLALSASAQKFGYVNSNLLLSELPDMKAADSELETYQKQLMASGETMVKAWQEKYQKIADEVSQGLLSAVEQQAKEQELAAEQQKIQAYELEVQQKLTKKREELIQPILDKVKVAIEAVGKENNYTMIFDSSAGTILHASESDNVLALVKTKLGL